ncbi:hypothetical protein [Legionella longbeachae]|uniref:hypothetical protein n=1 Tax=Legionella longbeachae TaxID=450 RepID=UPI000A1C0317|nr:hypothetical protein [Legionella longbeachae]ARM34947.1 hypothetical protein B0B39_16135 [Legionella longbeachae]QEY50896.1 hypothetical protein FQU71_06315 [Legionella longbeachae]
MTIHMMSAQIEAAEQYRSLLRKSQIIITSIEGVLGQLSKFVHELRFKKFEDFGWKKDKLEETDIEELWRIYLYLTEQLYCFQNKYTSRFELKLFLKQGGSIKLPCRIH